MATIRKEILTSAAPDHAWAAVRDIGALHRRLAPGFVIDTQLEPGARIVTFGNGLVVRESIVTIDDDARRLVWTVESERLAHHNGATQVFYHDLGARIVWIADILPDEAAPTFDRMMEDGAHAMKTELDRQAATVLT